MSSLGQRLAKKELQRRSQGTTGPIERLRSVLTPLQLDFIDNPSQYKLARCGRRAGKTFAVIVYMATVCLAEPNTPVLYLGLTRESAMATIWKPLTQMLSAAGIPYDPQSSRGYIVFDNGSYIRVFGADATDAVDRLRGLAWKLIVPDEMAFVRSKSADDLIETLTPSLADYSGTMAMISSPGPIPEGLFYESDMGASRDEWYKVHWTLRENPFFYAQPARRRPDLYPNLAEETIADALKRRFGGDTSHPAFRREYLGEWVFDDSNLIYPYTDKNVIRVLPQTLKGTYHHCIGVDFGSSSATSYAVLRYSDYSRQVELVDLFKRENMLVDEMAQTLEALILRYNPVFIEADTGGLGKVPAEEMRRRYGIPISAAEKTKKGFFQAIVRNDLAAGHIKVLLPHGEDLLKEWNKIVKDDAGEEIKGQENHSADAFLYGYRKIYNVHLKSFEEPLTEEDKMINQLEKSVLQQQLADNQGLDNTEEIW